VPLLPASLIEPLWVEFAALIESDRPEFDPTHPWGCHRRRIPDRVVFDHVIAALVHGSGYEPIATPGCSDRTIRRRLDDRALAGVSGQLLRAAPAGYDQMIGLDLDDLSVDGAITKPRAGARSPGAARSTAANRAPSGRWPATTTASRCTWSPRGQAITTRRCWSPPWPGS